MLVGWGGAGWGSSSSRVAIVEDPAGSKTAVLRVTYPQGSYSSRNPGGAHFHGRPVAPLRDAYLHYEVYFEKDFPWVKGGKLPGFYGGAKTCSAGRDSDQQHCFSTRLMWQKNGGGILYFYMTQHQHANFCVSPDVQCHFEDHRAVLGAGHPDFKFINGSWNKIQQYVKINDPGKFNGRIKVWVNNRIVVSNSKIAVYSDGIGDIDGIMFSTFFGGATTTWATPITTYSYFRNFRIYVV